MADAARTRPGALRRVPAVLSVAVLTAAVLIGPGAGVASGVHNDGQVGARGIDGACQGSPDVTFADGPFYDQLDAALDCVAADAYGPIAQGFGDDTYRPGSSVQRGRMATFVARTLEAAGVGVDRSAADAFDDDDDYADVHENNINALNALGIYEGAGGQANAEQNISREEFASLIRRALEEAGVSIAPDETGELFDGACATPHEQNVEALANHGIVQGTGRGGYGCGAEVSRGQMGLFLARSLDLGASEGVVTNPFETSNQAFEVTPAGEATKDVSSGPTDGTGRRAYEAAGLSADSDYVIALLDAEDVQGTPGQLVSFAEYDLADESTASIEQVHDTIVAPAGPGTASAQETATAGSDGTITFAIDSTEQDQVVPVVYADANGDGQLNLDGDGLPTEDFGLGGQANWTPAGAGDGGSGPAVTDASVANDAFPPGPTSTDEWTFEFTGDVTVGSGVALEVTDGTGTATVDSSNAAFSASGDTVTVTLNAFLIDGLSPLSYPLEVTAVSGITGSGGADSAVSEWSDMTVEVPSG